MSLHWVMDSAAVVRRRWRSAPSMLVSGWHVESSNHQASFSNSSSINAQAVERRGGNPVVAGAACRRYVEMTANTLRGSSTMLATHHSTSERFARSLAQHAAASARHIHPVLCRIVDQVSAPRRCRVEWRRRGTMNHARRIKIVWQATSTAHYRPSAKHVPRRYPCRPSPTAVVVDMRRHADEHCATSTMHCSK